MISSALEPVKLLRTTTVRPLEGKGKYTHAPHLSILLTDAKLTVTTPDGKTQIFDLKAGAAFWSDAETHIAINSGSKIAKAYIVELK
jgi:hypothetical protein